MLLLTALLACTESPLPAAPVADAQGLRVDEGSAEALGILGLLNDRGTTEALLDDDVGLDRRAAEALLAHRDGPDGTLGTRDDDPYDSIAEVDDQYYVGASAIDKLLAYALADGWVPDGDDVVGSWEGVSFTADEVAWTLALANDATHETLDDTVGLDRRAADGIVAARPFVDIGGLAKASYVGASALTALRDFASAGQGAGVGEDCVQTTDCASGLQCLGAIAYESGLFCVDTYGTFVSDEAVAIPEEGVSTSVEVVGLASVPVDVVLTVRIDHARPSDLTLRIDNFNGYGQSLWSNEAEPKLEMVVWAFPSDDEVHGEYTVTVADTVPGVDGTLLGWDLFIVSTYD